MQETILTAIQRRMTVDVSSAQMQQLGVLQDTIQMGKRVVRIPLLRYRWRLKLVSSVDESVLKMLRKDLHDIEVEAIALEHESK